MKKIGRLPKTWRGSWAIARWDVGSWAGIEAGAPLPARVDGPRMLSHCNFCPWNYREEFLPAGSELARAQLRSRLASGAASRPCLVLRLCRGPHP